MALSLCGYNYGGEIHDAVRNGDLKKVMDMVENNPKLVDQNDKDGYTPL